MSAPYYERAGVRIFHDDCLDVLPGVPAADLVVTDPPYAAETHANARSGNAADSPVLP